MKARYEQNRYNKMMEENAPSFMDKIKDVLKSIVIEFVKSPFISF